MTSLAAETFPGAVKQFGRWTELFARLGLETDALYSRLGLSDAVASMPSLHYAHFLSVLSRAEEEYGPALAEDIAGAKSVADFGIVGYLFMNAPTLRTGLEAACYWLPEVNSQAKMTIESTDRHVTLHYVVPGVPEDAGALDVEIALLALIRGVRAYTGRKDWLPEAVSFGHAPRANARSIEASLGDCVRFGQPGSGIRMPRALMRAENPNADTALFDILERQQPPQVPLAELAREDIVSAVARLIKEGVKNGRLAAEDIACELALSKRTLYRRLKEVGSSIGQIREATLIPVAKDLLAKQLDISTVAYRLGYSDSRSFARAFKRVTGMSPAAYRQYLQAATPIPQPASSSVKRSCAPGNCFFGSSPRVLASQNAHNGAERGECATAGQNASPTNR